MTKTWDVWDEIPEMELRGCYGKTPHTSYEAAERHLKRLQRQSAGRLQRTGRGKRGAVGDSGRQNRLEPYRCPFCHAWHLGNVTGPYKPRKKGGKK